VGGVIVLKTQAQPAGGFAGRGTVLQKIVKGLGLSQEQITNIKTELRAEKDNLVPLLKNLHETRKALRETIQSGGNETAIRAASAKVAAVEADLAVERAKLRARIVPLLTEEQLGKITNFEEKADNFVIEALRNFGKRLDAE
jgi:Spy/CpxP family protein refolding chaperone